MNRRTVLFVDDEINVLSSLKRGLIDEDYNCEFVSSAKGALDILEKKDISVIVTDMRMPEMDGLALLKIVKVKYPNVVRIVLSGYTQLQQVLLSINQGDIFRFITKPWKLEDEFKHVIRQAIDYYNLQMESIELRNALEARNISYQNMLKCMNAILDNDKKNFDIIKEVSSFIFDSLGENLQEMEMEGEIKLSPLSRLELARSIFTAYLDVLPAKAADFCLSKIVEDMKNFFTTMKNVNNFEYNGEELTDQKCTGNYSLLYFALTFTLGRLLDAEERYNIKFTSESEESVNHIRINILVEVNSIMNKKYGLTDNELSFIESFINRIINIFKGTVLILRLKDSIIVKFDAALTKSR